MTDSSTIGSTIGTIGGGIGSTSTSASTALSNVKNDFLTLHSAYAEEWMSVSFLPVIKTTYDPENSYYDISHLNLKNVNNRNLPFSESVLLMDKQYQHLKTSFDRLIAESPAQRNVRIETYQSSISTFIDRMKMVLEKIVVELGGNVDVDSTTTLSVATKHQLKIENKRSTIMARSRLQNHLLAHQNQVQMSITGVISMNWCEILLLVARLDVSVKSSKLQSIISNLAPLVFEWRVFMANATKIINEDKRFKSNPFVNNSVYDQSSHTFISAPILISTTYVPPSSNNNNNNNNSTSSSPTGGISIPSSSSSSSSSPQHTLLNLHNSDTDTPDHHHPHNQQQHLFDSYSSTPPSSSSINNSTSSLTSVQSPTSWTKAVKRPQTNQLGSSTSSTSSITSSNGGGSSSSNLLLNNNSNNSNNNSSNNNNSKITHHPVGVNSIYYQQQITNSSRMYDTSEDDDSDDDSYSSSSDGGSSSSSHIIQQHHHV